MFKSEKTACVVGEKTRAFIFVGGIHGGLDDKYPHSLRCLNAEYSFTRKDGKNNDVGFPSVRCGCHWLIKKLCFGPVAA